MKKRTLLQSITVAGIAAAIPLVSTSVAFAGTSFDTKYQANLSQETSLLQTAQSSKVSSTDITYLQDKVASLNNEISTLYNDEQSLASTTINVTPSNPSLEDQINQVQQQREQLLEDSKNEWGIVNRYFHRRDPKSHQMFDQAKQHWETIGVKVKAIDDLLNNLLREHDHGDDGNNTSKVAQAALSNLQNSILNMQTSVIDYTKEWIALEQVGTTTTTTTTTTLPAPTGLSVSNETNTSFTVSWTSVSGASSYNIYVGNKEFAGVTGNSYTITGENPGTTYTVEVKSVNASGQESASSSQISATTNTQGDQLSVSSITSSGWTLNWSAVSGAAYYDVYSGSTLVASHVGDTSYTFSGEPASTAFNLTVHAYDAAGNEIAVSNTSTVTTLA